MSKTMSKTPAKALSKSGAEPEADEADIESEAVLDASDGADEPVDVETDTAAEDSGATVARSRWRPSGRAIVLGAAALVVVGAVATAAVLGLQLRSQRAVTAAEQQAVATAQQYAITLTSIDGGQLDQNFAAVLDGATGEFKDMYAQSSEQLKQALVDNKAMAKGTVISAGVKSATENRVEVMLFVDQSVTNALNPEPRLDRSRIIMTMEKVNGRWLASKVELP